MIPSRFWGPNKNPPAKLKDLKISKAASRNERNLVNAALFNDLGEPLVAAPYFNEKVR